MEYYDGVIVKPELSEDTLEHYGVKGMHWGVRHDNRVQKRRDRKIKKYEKINERRRKAGKADKYIKPSSREEADDLIERRALKTATKAALTDMAAISTQAAVSSIILKAAANNSGLDQFYLRDTKPSAKQATKTILKSGVRTAVLYGTGSAIVNEMRYRKTGYVKNPESSKKSKK